MSFKVHDSASYQPLENTGDAPVRTCSPVLPEDILLECFGWTIICPSDLQSATAHLVTCSMVNRTWHKVATHNTLWMNLFQECYGALPEILPPSFPYYLTHSLFKRTAFQLLPPKQEQKPLWQGFLQLITHATNVLTEALSQYDQLEEAGAVKMDADIFYRFLNENKEALNQLPYLKFSIFNHLDYFKDLKNILQLMLLCKNVEVLNFVGYQGEAAVLIPAIKGFSLHAHSPQLVVISPTQMKEIEKHLSISASNQEPLNKLLHTHTGSQISLIVEPWHLYRIT